MDKVKKKNLRGILFRHLDGISLCSTVSALHKKGVTKYILEHPSFTIQDILSDFDSNTGYLNVALRLLASQGWLEREIIQDSKNINFQLTQKGKTSLPLAYHYDTFYHFFPILINMDKYLFNPSFFKMTLNFSD